jgi:hypothetical protein
MRPSSSRCQYFVGTFVAMSDIVTRSFLEVTEEVRALYQVIGSMQDSGFHHHWMIGRSAVTVATELYELYADFHRRKVLGRKRQIPIM